MSRRVALIPEELISSHQYQDPETRLEDEIGSLLDRKKIPDDMKVKLLSQLIMRYQKTFHTPPEPIPVTVQNNQISESDKKEKQSDENSVENVDSHEERDSVMRSILISTPTKFRKYVPMIVGKMKTRNYFWNSNEEMTAGNNPINGSNIIDYFTYLFRNSKNLSEPYNFDSFLKVLSEINIPISWIANKNVVDRLKRENTEDPSSYNAKKVSSFMKRESKLEKNSREPRSHSLMRWDRSRSRSPKKPWIEF